MCVVRGASEGVMTTTPAASAWRRCLRSATLIVNGHGPPQSKMSDVASEGHGQSFSGRPSCAMLAEVVTNVGEDMRVQFCASGGTQTCQIKWRSLIRLK